MAVTSASYSITVRIIVEPDDHTAVGRVTTAVGEAQGAVVALDFVESDERGMIVDLTANAHDTEHAKTIRAAIDAVDGVTVHKVSDRTFLMHLGGKIEVRSKVALRTRDELSMAYTPGVARVSMAIYEKPEDARNLTIKGNTVAIVTDGSAVLGLGDIGPIAALPVMEGKAALFKRFAGIDAFPICLDTKDTEEIIRTVQIIAPVFGGVNLEDIAAPRCFEIEERLRDLLDIPVFHDDQHGTAIVALAALHNALKVVGKQMSDITVSMSGAGAAGVAVAKILMEDGVGDIIASDSKGIIHRGREFQDPSKQWLAANTNATQREGSLLESLDGTDVFIGVSAPQEVALEGPSCEAGRWYDGEHARYTGESGSVSAASIAARRTWVSSCPDGGVDVLGDRHDVWHGDWSLRRQGNGRTGTTASAHGPSRSQRHPPYGPLLLFLLHDRHALSRKY